MTDGEFDAEKYRQDRQGGQQDGSSKWPWPCPAIVLGLLTGLAGVVWLVIT